MWLKIGFAPTFRFSADVVNANTSVISRSVVGVITCTQFGPILIDLIAHFA